MSNIDRGYINLLAILRAQSSSIPINSLVAGITHYLSHSPPTQPSPTPLASAVVQSSIWQSRNLRLYIDLGNAFGQALLVKSKELSEQKRGLFSLPRAYGLREWINGILEGVKSGDPLVRLNVYRGLLLGLDSLEDAEKLSWMRTRATVEKRAVLAFAEAVDQSEGASKAWVQEFKPGSGSYQIQDMAIILSAQYFTKLDASVLSTLNTPSMVSLLLHTLKRAFYMGNFLDGSQDAMIRNDSGNIVIEKSSEFALGLDQMKASDLNGNIPSICRLLAHIVAIFSSNDSSSRRSIAWSMLNEIIDALDELATATEAGWSCCPLATLDGDEVVDPDSLKVSTDVWRHLKTLVFAIVMAQLPVLRVLLYLPPLEARFPNTSGKSRELQAPILCTQMVRTLSRLSFVVMQLGGVSAMPPQSANTEEYQFKELKQVFFMAMDVISAHPEQAETLVKDVASSCGPEAGTPLQRAKRAFALSCIEQLVPVLSEACVVEVVLPLCEPHLSDYSHRELYESSHSVILSIFATHAKRSGDYQQIGNSDSVSTPSLAERLVPGYVKCLLENVTEGRLTTTQFRLAFSALVRSAGARNMPRIQVHSNVEIHDQDPSVSTTALAKLCISSLLTASQSPSLNPSERLRLHLTLASLISNVSIDLLPYLLHEVDQAIIKQSDPVHRKAVIGVIYDELMEKVGDKEKNVVMRWWLQGAKRWRELEGFVAEAGVEPERTGA